MSDLIVELFEDNQLVAKLKRKLPYIFKVAEVEISRGGHVGMEVGTLRERAIIALFMYKFGEGSVQLDIPINETEIDLRLVGHRNPISIKTKTGKGFSGVKLKWTVDWAKVEEFYNSYYPSSGIIFVQINWEDIGLFAYIPLEVQEKVFNQLGRERYIRLPKQGTNPRGIEISAEALKKCLSMTNYKVPIEWKLEGPIYFVQ